MIVEIEGGTKLELPDGSSPQQIDGVIAHYKQSQGPQVKGIDAPQPFTEAYGENVDGYAQQVGDQFTKPFEMDKSAGGEVIQRIGDAGGRVANTLAGIVGGVVMAPVEAGIETKVTQPIARQFVDKDTTLEQKQKLATVAKDTADLGSMALMAPRALKTAQNPATLNQIPSAAKAAGQKVVSLGTAIEKKLQNAPGIIGNTSGAPITKPLVASTDIKAAATKAYQEAANNGGVLTPQFTDQVLNYIDSAKPKTQLGQMLGKNDPVVTLADDIAGKRGQPITLAEAQEFDELLTETIEGLLDAGRMTKKAGKIMDIQSEFRDMIDNVAPHQVQGGTAGFEALKDGRALWSAQAKMRDIEKIIQRAEMTDNPATAIKTGFRNLSLNEKRMRGYDAQTRSLIKKAAETGIVGDILAIAGSRLNPIAAGATGGLGNALMTHAASAGARGLRTKVQVGRAQKVNRSLSDKIESIAKKYP